MTSENTSGKANPELEELQFKEICKKIMNKDASPQKQNLFSKPSVRKPLLRPSMIDRACLNNANKAFSKKAVVSSTPRISKHNYQFTPDSSGSVSPINESLVEKDNKIKEPSCSHVPQASNASVICISSTTESAKDSIRKQTKGNASRIEENQIPQKAKTLDNIISKIKSIDVQPDKVNTTDKTAQTSNHSSRNLQEVPSVKKFARNICYLKDGQTQTQRSLVENSPQDSSSSGSSSSSETCSILDRCDNASLITNRCKSGRTEVNLNESPDPAHPWRPAGLQEPILPDPHSSIDPQQKDDTLDDTFLPKLPKKKKEFKNKKKTANKSKNKVKSSEHPKAAREIDSGFKENDVLVDQQTNVYSSPDTRSRRKMTTRVEGIQALTSFGQNDNSDIKQRKEKASDEAVGEPKTSKRKSKELASGICQTNDTNVESIGNKKRQSKRRTQHVDISIQAHLSSGYEASRDVSSDDHIKKSNKKNTSRNRKSKESSSGKDGDRSMSRQQSKNKQIDPESIDINDNLQFGNISCSNEKDISVLPAVPENKTVQRQSPRKRKTDNTSVLSTGEQDLQCGGSPKLLVVVERKSRLQIRHKKSLDVAEDGIPQDSGCPKDGTRNARARTRNQKKQINDNSFQDVVDNQESLTAHDDGKSRKPTYRLGNPVKLFNSVHNNTESGCENVLQAAGVESQEVETPEGDNSNKVLSPVHTPATRVSLRHQQKNKVQCENASPQQRVASPQRPKTKQNVSSTSKKVKTTAKRGQELADTANSVRSQEDNVSGVRRSSRARKPVTRVPTTLVLVKSERELLPYSKNNLVYDAHILKNSLNLPSRKRTSTNKGKKSVSTLCNLVPIQEVENEGELIDVSVSASTSSAKSPKKSKKIRVKAGRLTKLQKNEASSKASPQKSKKTNVKAGRVKKQHKNRTEERKLRRSLTHTISTNGEDELSALFNVDDNNSNALEWAFRKLRYEKIDSIPGLSAAIVRGVTGFLKIDAGKSKPKQVSHHELSFSVLEGRAEVGLKDQSVNFNKTDVFFIPAGSEYSISNLSDTEDVVLHFIKLPVK